MADENYAIRVSFEGINDAIGDIDKLQSAIANIKAPVFNFGGDEASKLAEASLKKIQLEIDALEEKKAKSAANDLLRAEQLAAKQEQNAQRDAQREADATARKEQNAQKVLDQLEKQFAAANVRVTQGGNEGPDKEAKFTAQTLQEALRYKQQLAAIDKAGFSAADAANAKELAAGINSLNLQKIEQDFAKVNTGQRNFTGNLRDAAEQLSVFAAKVNELKQISVDYAKEANQASRLLSTRSDNSPELIAGLKGVNAELKSQITTTELVRNAYENIPAQFLKTADATKVTVAAAKLAQGSQSDLGGTTKGLSQLLVAYSADANQAATFADKLAFASKQTAEKSDVLALQLARLTPAAKAAGLSFDDLNALLIQSTNQGIPARQALSAIEGSLKQITTDTARQEFARLGIVFDENILKQKGYVGLLKEVNESQNLAADSITKIFGEQAKLNKIIPAGADGFKKLDEAVQGSIKSSGLANTQFEKTSTVAKAVQVSVEEAFTVLGQAVLKVANPVLQGTKAMADAFVALPPPIQNTIGALVGGFGVFLSVSAALTGILAVVTPTIGAFKILATTFATLGTSSLVSIFDGIGTSLRKADGSATKFAENLKTVGTAVGLLALAYVGIEVGKNIFDQLTSQARETENATKDLTKSYEEYLRVLKKTPGVDPTQKPKTLRQEVDEKRDFTSKALDFTKDVVTFGLPIGRSRLDNQVDEKIIAFSEKITASDKAIKEIEQLQSRLAKGEKLSQKEIQATTQIIQDNINSFKNFDALGEQKALRNVQLNALDALLDRQNKLTASKIQETEAIQKAATNTKQQLDQAIALKEIQNQDAEKNIKRTFDDAKVKQDRENAKAIAAIEEQNALKKGELDRKQALETEALKEKQTLALQDKQRAFDETQNAKKLQLEDALDAKKRANEEKLNALKQQFDDKQNALKEQRADKQRKDDEAFAAQRAQRDKQASEALSGAKQLISNEGAIATAKPEDRAKIAAQIEEENRIRAQAATQGVAGGTESQEQLVAKAKQIAQISAIANGEEQKKVQLALDELEKANKAKQLELDKAEDAKRTEDKRVSDRAFEAELNASKLAFDAVQNTAKLNFENTVLKPEKQKIEAELNASKLAFETGELAAIKKQQAAEERALQLQQINEDNALKKAADAELEALKIKQKDAELAKDRAFEDAKIERERAFKEQQRALDKASAIEIQQILGKSAQQIISALSVAKGASPFSGAVGVGKVPAFASGVTNFKGGMALVGEQGAELVTLPRGSNVLPANQTKQVLNNNSGGNKTFNVNVTTAATNAVEVGLQVQKELARSMALSM